MYKFKGNYYVLSLIVVFFILPGRLQGYLWRDFFNGRKLMSINNSEEAIYHFKKFEDKLNKKPWLKNAIYLAGFIYTKSIMVMTLNNLGACYLESGKFNDAKNYFESALEIDTQFPLSYYNLSIISEIEDYHELAINQFNTSVELGYSRNTLDQVIHKAGEMYAQFEGRAKNEKA